MPVEATRRDPIQIATRAADELDAAAEVEPVEPVGATDRRSDDRQARREAKLEARRKRASAREAAAAARAAKDAATAPVVEPERAPEPEPEPAPAPEPEPEPEPAPEPEPEPAPAPEPEPLTEVLARHGAFDRPRAVPSPPAGDATDETEPTRSRKRLSGSRRGKDDPVDDGIVEAPREPKKSLRDRLRSTTSPRSDVEATGPSSPAPAARSDQAGKAGGRSRRLVSVLAGVIGAAGLVGSVVLAFGALLVALGSTTSSMFDTVSSVCDALVGPLADAFSFSGTNAAMKESLVAWGAGAIVYLVVGMVAQSLLRSTVDD